MSIFDVDDNISGVHRQSRQVGAFAVDDGVFAFAELDRFLRVGEGLVGDDTSGVAEVDGVVAECAGFERIFHGVEFVPALESFSGSGGVRALLARGVDAADVDDVLFLVGHIDVVVRNDQIHVVGEGSVFCDDAAGSGDGVGVDHLVRTAGDSGCINGDGSVVGQRSGCDGGGRIKGEGAAVCKRDVVDEDRFGAVGEGRAAGAVLDGQGAQIDVLASGDFELTAGFLAAFDFNVAVGLCECVDVPGQGSVFGDIEGSALDEQTPAEQHGTVERDRRAFFHLNLVNAVEAGVRVFACGVLVRLLDDGSVDDDVGCVNFLCHRGASEPDLGVGVDGDIFADGDGLNRIIGIAEERKFADIVGGAAVFPAGVLDGQSQRGGIVCGQGEILLGADVEVAVVRRAGCGIRDEFLFAEELEGCRCVADVVEHVFRRCEGVETVEEAFLIDNRIADVVFSGEVGVDEEGASVDRADPEIVVDNGEVLPEGGENPEVIDFTVSGDVDELVETACVAGGINGDRAVGGCKSSDCDGRFHIKGEGAAVCERNRIRRQFGVPDCHDAVAVDIESVEFGAGAIRDVQVGLRQFRIVRGLVGIVRNGQTFEFIGRGIVENVGGADADNAVVDEPTSVCNIEGCGVVVIAVRIVSLLLAADNRFRCFVAVDIVGTDGDVAADDSKE